MKAAAICLRWNDGGLQVLLVKSSKDHWIFPKGTVETNETPAHAALRELKEEAGYLGAIDCRCLETDAPLDPVAYLVLNASKAGIEEAGRTPEWHPLRRAKLLFVREHDPEKAVSLILALWAAVDRWQTEAR